MIELKGFEPFAGFADSDHFGVCSGIVGGGDAVHTGGDKGAVFGHGGSERAAAIANVFERKRDGLAHEIDGHVVDFQCACFAADAQGRSAGFSRGKAGEGIGEDESAAGDVFWRSVFVGAVAVAMAARDEQHGGGSDA
jgi:hypothetical protein